MNTFHRDISRFAVPGGSPFPSWQFGSGSFFPMTFQEWKVGLWRAVNFLTLVPLALAMLGISLLARVAVIVLAVLLIPVLILAPVLGISLMVMAFGFLLQLFGVS